MMTYTLSIPASLVCEVSGESKQAIREAFQKAIQLLMPDNSIAIIEVGKLVASGGDEAPEFPDGLKDAYVAIDSEDMAADHISILDPFGETL